MSPERPASIMLTSDQDVPVERAIWMAYDRLRSTKDDEEWQCWSSLANRAM